MLGLNLENLRKILNINVSLLFREFEPNGLELCFSSCMFTTSELKKIICDFTNMNDDEILDDYNTNAYSNQMSLVS